MYSCMYIYIHNCTYSHTYMCWYHYISIYMDYGLHADYKFPWIIGLRIVLRIVTMQKSPAGEIQWRQGPWWHRVLLQWPRRMWREDRSECETPWQSCWGVITAEGQRQGQGQASGEGQAPSVPVQAGSVQPVGCWGPKQLTDTGSSKTSRACIVQKTLKMIAMHTPDICVCIHSCTSCMHTALRATMYIYIGTYTPM